MTELGFKKILTSWNNELNKITIEWREIYLPVAWMM